MMIAPLEKSSRLLRFTVLVPLVALWFPIHNLLGIEVHSVLLNVVITIILLALIAVALKSRKSSTLSVAELTADLKARNIELVSSHNLVSQIDIETRREVGAWLHGQVHLHKHHLM